MVWVFSFFLCVCIISMKLVGRIYICVLDNGRSVENRGGRGEWVGHLCHHSIQSIYRLEWNKKRVTFQCKDTKFDLFTLQ